MSRLILIPQYPAKLRYQEWWYTEFPKNYIRYFDEVIVLGSSVVEVLHAPSGGFSPVVQAIEFELQQMKEYLALELKSDDILLLCDISFPGFFGNILFHKRPAYCFAICHATSKNRYDYFAKERPGKWRTETGLAKLFDKIFVATEYHRNKLGWGNTMVVGLPLPPEGFGLSGGIDTIKSRDVVSVARDHPQKRNKILESKVETLLGIKVETPIGVSSWEEYYSFLSESKVMLITAQEETFGYQVIDALLNQCIPIAPNRYSYPELLPREYLYDIGGLLSILPRALSGQLPQPKFLPRILCHSFFANTAQIMQCSKGRAEE